MRTPLIAVVICLTTACSNGESATPTNAGKCADVAKAGATVTDVLIDKGCTDTNGTLRVGKVETCKNGQRLWKMNDLAGMSGQAIVSTKTRDGALAESLLDLDCLK